MSSLAGLLEPRLLRRLGYSLETVVQHGVQRDRASYHGYHISNGAIWRAVYQAGTVTSDLICDRYRYISVLAPQQADYVGWLAITADYRLVADGTLLTNTPATGVLCISRNAGRVTAVFSDGRLYEYSQGMWTLADRRQSLHRVIGDAFLTECGHLTTTEQQPALHLPNVQKVAATCFGVAAWTPGEVYWRDQCLQLERVMAVGSVGHWLLVLTADRLYSWSVDDELMTRVTPEKLVDLCHNFAYGESGRVYYLVADLVLGQLYFLPM